MARRSKLGGHLVEAWRRTIKEDYCKGHINSERSLQALLVANLRTVFREEVIDRRIFVEPAIRLHDGRLIRPDIVVCNAREAICFVELKYAPRGIASTAKDMRSISAIARSEDISIALQRYRGPQLPPMVFRMSKATLFAWAGIHAGDTAPSTLWDTDEAFADHFYLEMHAKTIRGSAPEERYNTDALRVKKPMPSDGPGPNSLY